MAFGNGQIPGEVAMFSVNIRDVMVHKQLTKIRYDFVMIHIGWHEKWVAILFFFIII